MSQKAETAETYKVDVKSILDSVGESIEISDVLHIEALGVGEGRFVAREPFRFDVRLINTGSGIVALGSVVACVLATCARCLCEFPTEISAEVDGFYLEAGKESNLPDDEVTELLDADGYIDLFPSLVSALVLEVPFAPLHDEECAGMCVVCGTDLNTGSCSCGEESDPMNPFAALGSLVVKSGPDSE